MLLLRCSRCHRPLKDQESIKRGLGLVCFRKIGGVVKSKRRTRFEDVPIWEQVEFLFEEESDD